MPRRTAADRPVITLLSDFGLRDSYVAEMKIAILRYAPAAQLIDVTHSIAPQDVLAGSFCLQRVIQSSDSRTYHLAVVDPGVGSNRRILIVEIGKSFIICPDNGLITWPWKISKGGKAWALKWKPEDASKTFHGRDIMAPAIAKLSIGTNIQTLARPIDDPMLLGADLAAPGDTGRVIHIDHFGNATTNIPARAISGDASLRVGRRSMGPLRQTYSDVAVGKALALIGSADLVEIAVRDGSAAHTLGLKIGDEVKLV